MPFIPNHKRVNESNGLIFFHVYCFLQYTQCFHGLMPWHFIAHLIFFKCFKIFQLYKIFSSGKWAIAASLKMYSKNKHEYT